jgi:hypothetical protein
LAVLIASPTALAWDQLRGGPERGGVATVPGAPLDVVASFATIADDVRATQHLHAWYGQGFVATPGGWLAEHHDPTVHGNCTLVRVTDPLRGAFESTPLPPCNFGGFDAYDARDGLLLLCAEGTNDAPVLLALDARTLEVRWDVRPGRDLGATAPSLGEALFAIGFDFNWYCSGSAIDLEGGEVVVPFTEGAGFHNRVASIELATGRVRWWTEVPASLVYAGHGAGVPSPPATVEGSGFGFGPQVATLTTSGVLVTGVLFCAQCASDLVQRGIAWLTREGAFVGGVAASPTEEGDLVPGGSQWAASAGSLGAVAMGRRLLLIDPQSAQPVLRAPLDTLEPLNTECAASGNVAPESAGSCSRAEWVAPVWWQKTILVPVVHSVTAFSDVDLSKRWAWTEGLDWFVHDILVSNAGSASVLLSRGGENDTQAEVVQLSMQTGDVLQKLPLPDPRPGLNGWAGRLQPLPGEGLLVVRADGHLYALGPAPADRVPALRLSGAFPRPGEAVSLQVEPGGGGSLTRVLVGWGEGPIEELAPGQLAQHTYGAPGPREVVVTAVYADGRTGTATALVHVGGTPPQELTLLQQAFAPDNQNLTFGLVGIALAAGGGLVALERRHRRRGRMGRELARLEELRALGEARPAQALRELGAYRAGLHAALGEGNLDEAQYGALETRAARLAAPLRRRVLAAWEGRASPRFLRLLDAALEDGVLSAAEAGALREAMRGERLSARQREELAGLLGALLGDASVE